MRTTLSFLLIILLISPAAFAMSTGDATYPTANTDQAVTSAAVLLNNTLYILQNSALYTFNITSKDFKKVFDMGFSFIGTSLIYKDGYFYISAYKLYNAAPGGGGGDIPVPTCPLPIDISYNATNFTVYKLTKDFDVINTISIPVNFYEGLYFKATSAMKLIDADSKILAFLTGYTDTTGTNAVSYIYEITDAATQKLSINERILDMSYANNTLYVLTDEKKIYAYDTQGYSLKNTYTGEESMNAIVADSGHIYVAGYSKTSDSTQGAMVEVLTTSFATEYYRVFEDTTYAFMSIATLDNIIFASYGPELYLIDWKNNTILKVYTPDYTHTYDMKTEKIIDISGKGLRARFIKPYKNNTGKLEVFWGGYYLSDNLMYAYFVGTDKPESWEYDTTSGNAGLPSLDDWDWSWLKKSYYGLPLYIWLIAIVIILFLLGGGRRE